jgi:hypothetical protein
MLLEKHPQRPVQELFKQLSIRQNAPCKIGADE